MLLSLLKATRYAPLSIDVHLLTKKQVFVQDGEGSKGSSHGTYLGTNGSTDIMQRLSTRPCEVHAGDVLSFGKHVGSDYQGQSGLRLLLIRADDACPY